MKQPKMVFSLIGITAILSILPTVALADSTVTMTYVGGTTESLGGYLTGPYAGKVEDAAVRMICDDFGGQVSNGQTWEATARSFTALGSTAGPNGQAGAKFWSHLDPTTSGNNYAAVGWLALQIFDNGSLTRLQRGEMSFAIWDIFTANTINNRLTGDPKTAALSYRAQAFANSGGSANLAAYSSLTVYTPDPLTQGTQEMIVKTPEPSAAALLGLYMSGLLGLFAVVRRRIRRQNQE